MANSAIVGILRALLTADTAQYDAGMRKAATTAQTVDRQLKLVGQTVRGVGPQFERMVKSFQGDKLLYQANNLTAAVQKIGGAAGIVGGAAKLTEAEQTRVNRTVTEAIAKYTALGKQAPPAMLALANATKQVEPPTSFLTTRMVALGAAVGTFAAQMGMQAVRSLIQFGREAFNSASRILDLSNKTGESTDSIQRMDFVARQTGTSLEAMTGAAFMLRTRLAGGSTSVLKALEDLRKASGDAGLSVQSSADQILAALSGVDDTNTRVRLGTALFGRSFRELAASVTEGYAQIASGAAVAERAQLEALDRASDAWAAFVSNTQTRITQFLGNTVLLSQAIKEIVAEGGVFQSTAAVIEQAQRRITLGLLGRRTKDIGLPDEVAQSVETYTQRLKDAQRALEGLTAAQRAELSAAQQMGASQEDQIKLLSDWKIEADTAEGVLKLFTASLASAKKEAADLTRWIDENKEAITRLNKTLADAAKVGVPLKEVLEEFGGQIEDTVHKAIIFHQAVPPALMAAAAALGRLQMAQKEGLKPIDWDAFLGAIPDQIPVWEKVFTAIDAKQQESLARRHTGIIEAAQFNIDLAKRRGASERQLFDLVEDLERKKLDVALGAENARFEIATRGIDKHSELFRQLEIAHQNTINHLNEQWAVGVERRAALFESEIERVLKSAGASLRGAFIGDLGTLLFGGLEDASRDFGERFTDMWRGIKSTLLDILDDILEYFTKQFLAGLIKGITGAKIGQALGNAIAGGVGLSVAGGTAAAATTAGAGFAAAEVAGVEAAAFGAAGAGGGFGATVAGLATNPITIAAAGALVLGLGISKRGWFRGGEEALKVNPRRDQFQLQFGGPTAAQGGMKLAALLTQFTGAPSGGPLFSALQRADSEREFDAAQANIISTLARFGRRVRSFEFGGFVPPGAVVPAILHGGSRGEWITPGGPIGKTVNMAVTIQAWDGADVRRVFRSDVLPALKQALTLDTDGILGHTRRAIRP
jgi:hypothetical protein